MSQTWETEKKIVLDLLATTKTYQHSSHTKSKAQQLLGRKLAVS